MLLFPLLVSSCNEDYLEPVPVVSNAEGLRISMGEPLTRSVDADAVLGEMRLYCFDRSSIGGSEPTTGTSSAYAPVGTANPMTPFHHQVQGLTKAGMTLHTDQMRVGKWDVVMIASRGASFTPPVEARRADQLLMYTFDPTTNGGQAHEFYHNYCRIPEITASNHPYMNASVSRNVAKVQVVVQRATDINTSAPAGSHTVAIDGIPRYISWAGTLLRSNSGTYVSDRNAFDVFPDGTSDFVRNLSFTPATEAGTYKADTINYIIPAHRSSDFWQVNTTNNTLEMNPASADTITRKLTLSVKFTKASGGTFTKSVTIPRVPQCNKILQLIVRMNDVNLEVKSDVLPWSSTEVEGSVNGAFLNVSKTETEVYDGSVSRVYFWSNQPVGSVYVANAGKTEAGAAISDVNTIFDRLAGASATNLHYDPATREGYIDISQANTSAALPSQATKIYLNAGGLKREIVVKQTVSALAALKITTPYVGTFHRASQTGERIVTWNYSGDWNAVVEGPAKDDVLIDRQPSPYYSGGVLYSANPGDPERATVSNWGGTVTGRDRIYFRLGWKSTYLPTAAAPARYATVVVRQGLTPGAGTVIQTLYLRQGENPDYLFSTTDAYTTSTTGVSAPNWRPATRKISPFNLTSPDRNPAAGGTPLSPGGGAFTLYPSQAGALFQWTSSAKTGYAFNPVNPVGAISGWENFVPSSYWDNLQATNETCPTGYRRPNDGNTSSPANTGTVAGSEMRQSLWARAQENATAKTLDNAAFGYYADGFFDRRSIASSVTAQAHSAVSPSGSDVAYAGLVVFNPTTKASVFFPAAGVRFSLDGNLAVTAGAEGYYWSSSSNGGTAGSLFYFFDTAANPASYTRNNGHSIRCIESPDATLTFHLNGATGMAPPAITAKELTPISLPGKGSMNKTGYYFSGWSATADGTGTHYPAGLGKMPVGGGTLYARWLYLDAGAVIAVPNNLLTGNTTDVDVDISGGPTNAFTVVQTSAPWITATAQPGDKLRITAPQSPNSDRREGTVTIAHADDPSYQKTIQVVQDFYTNIPPFDYFFMRFNWVRNNDDLDVAVEFRGNKLLSTGLPPAFDSKPVGLGFYQPTDVYGKLGASYIDTSGARFFSGSVGSGLLYWGGDAIASGTSPECVFFDAAKINAATDLERFVYLDVYAIWWGAGAQPGRKINFSISAYQGGTISYNSSQSSRQYTISGGTNVYPNTTYDIAINKKTTTNDASLYDSRRGFETTYQRIATITYDRKSRKASIQWR